MIKKQRFYGDKSIIVMLALLSAFPPLSTDLYLPALPHMMGVLDASQSAVNLSLSLFLIFFALGILVWGPISEKFGRKPVLLTGLVLYTLGSVGCALSVNVTMLILSRVVQAFGGGASGAVAAAMVKDMYDGRKRETVLAVVMTMVVVAPVVAPTLGAMILQFMSWRAIFWALSGFAFLSLCLSTLLTETLEERYSGSVLHSLGRLGVVLKNPGFSILLGIFSLVPLPLMAYIASSAFIYIDGFGMGEQEYGLYFGFNALGSLVGPLLFLRLSRWISSQAIITSSFVILALCGVIIGLFGTTSPNVFALTLFVSTIGTSMMRPPSANILLSQQDKDTGSAASLINFTAMFMGSLGMFLISLQTTKALIPTLGILQILVGASCCCVWLLVRKRPFIRS